MKYISVPINNDAMERLNLDQNIDGDLIEIILNDNEYKSLQASGVLEKINVELLKNIDEYEDEKIINSDELDLLKNIVEEIIKYNCISDSEILMRLLSQIKNAIYYNTGIFFFF